MSTWACDTASERSSRLCLKLSGRSYRGCSGDKATGYSGQYRHRVSRRGSYGGRIEPTSGLCGHVPPFRAGSILPVFTQGGGLRPCPRLPRLRPGLCLAPAGRRGRRRSSVASFTPYDAMEDQKGGCFAPQGDARTDERRALRRGCWSHRTTAKGRCSRRLCKKVLTAELIESTICIGDG